jgi:hypothetical protein
MNVVERHSANEPALAPNEALVSRLSGGTFSLVGKDPMQSPLIVLWHKCGPPLSRAQPRQSAPSPGSFWPQRNWQAEKPAFSLMRRPQ